MRRASNVGGFAVCAAVTCLAGVAGMIGCAVGTDEITTEGDLVGYERDSGETDANPGAKLPPPSVAAEDAGDDDEDAGKNDAGDAGDGGKDGGPPTTGCTAPNTCMTGATDLGSVSGDDNADSKSAQGTSSQWLTVRVTEDISGLIGNSLKMKAVLTSPPGMNFDLFVYVPNDDVRECSTVSKSSTSTAATDTASVEFGEGAIPNGDDDDRTVTVEVRYVSGTCSTANKWSLSVLGNTN